MKKAALIAAFFTIIKKSPKLATILDDNCRRN